MFQITRLIDVIAFNYRILAIGLTIAGINLNWGMRFVGFTTIAYFPFQHMKTRYLNIDTNNFVIRHFSQKEALIDGKIFRMQSLEIMCILSLDSMSFFLRRRMIKQMAFCHSFQNICLLFLT